MAAAVLLAYVPRLPSRSARPFGATVDLARSWPTGLGLQAAASGSRRARTAACGSFAMTQIAFSFVLLAGAGTLARRARRAADGQHRLQHCGRCWRSISRRPSLGDRRTRQEMDFYQERDPAHRRAAGRRGRRARQLRAVARRRHVRSPARSSPSRATRPRTAKRTRTRGCGSSRPVSSPCSASRCSPAATSPTTIGRQRARRDREPERRAAAVPQRRRA